MALTLLTSDCLPAISVKLADSIAPLLLTGHTWEHRRPQHRACRQVPSATAADTAVEARTKGSSQPLGESPDTSNGTAKSRAGRRRQGASEPESTPAEAAKSPVLRAVSVPEMADLGLAAADGATPVRRSAKAEPHGKLSEVKALRETHLPSCCHCSCHAAVLP